MATTQHFDKIISVDSHVMEPYDIWWNAIGQKWGDRTPRVLDEYQGQKGKFFYNGYGGWPVSEIRDFDPTSDAAALEVEQKGLGEAGFNPEIRVRFQEQAGVRAEVMNATRMLGILRNPDAEVLRACAEVFNDWMAEFVSYNPSRLIGASVIPMHDIEWATKELEKTTKKGLRAAMINCQAPEGSPHYRDSAYDKFWATAQEADAPLILHILTGRTLDPLVFAQYQTTEERAENPRIFLELYGEIQGVLANDFIFGQVLDRFPRLKIVCSEFEMSWAPNFMATIDRLQDPYGFGPRMYLPDLEMKASDYMRTRVYHGFIDDVAAEGAIRFVGSSQVLWGSDFPHLRSIGLNAQSAVHKLVENLPREDQEKIVGGNVAKMLSIVD